MKYITQKDMRKLIGSVSSQRDSLVIRIIYETGCSLKELAGIKVSDIAGNMIRTGKAARFSQISGKLSKDLKLYTEGNSIKKESLLFDISGRRISQLTESHAEKILGTRLTPHDLRNLHIMHAYLNGVYLENIAGQTGLSELRIFQIISSFNVKPERNYGNFLKRT
ncbi:hypothetical protein QT06_C0001G0156 [archaeon GW2011_AR15]|nr:hypothetical protein QT06_C0001G0156 [archaeon GW2011_AR15]